jgi:hypothetical protein
MTATDGGRRRASYYFAEAFSAKPGPCWRYVADSAGRLAVTVSSFIRSLTGVITSPCLRSIHNLSVPLDDSSVRTRVASPRIYRKSDDCSGAFSTRFHLPSIPHNRSPDTRRRERRDRANTSSTTASVSAPPSASRLATHPATRRQVRRSGAGKVQEVLRLQADQRRRAFEKVGLALPDEPCTTPAEVAAALDGTVVAYGQLWWVRSSDGWEPGLAGLVDVLIGGLMHLAPPYESKIASLKRDVKDRLRVTERPSQSRSPSAGLTSLRRLPQSGLHH